MIDWNKEYDKIIRPLFRKENPDQKYTMDLYEPIVPEIPNIKKEKKVFRNKNGHYVEFNIPEPSAINFFITYCLLLLSFLITSGIIMVVFNSIRNIYNGSR